VDQNNRNKNRKRCDIIATPTVVPHQSTLQPVEMDWACFRETVGTSSANRPVSCSSPHHPQETLPTDVHGQEPWRLILLVNGQAFDLLELVVSVRDP
jgi:hypothetical protein